MENRFSTANFSAAPYGPRMISYEECGQTYVWRYAANKAARSAAIADIIRKIECGVIPIVDGSQLLRLIGEGSKFIASRHIFLSVIRGRLNHIEAAAMVRVIMGKPADIQ